MVDNVIILAAGKSFHLDGKNKLLIRHPHTRRTILDYMVDAFSGKNITVVVGFGALQIMEDYPHINYVINENWASTNNAMSLGMALSQVKSPTYVVSGDMVFYRDLVEEMDRREGNLILTENRENRTLTSIHCAPDNQGCVREIYQGPIRSQRHPEAIGLFKVSDAGLLENWHKQCLRYGNLFAAQVMPCTEFAPVYTCDLGHYYFREINSIADYWRLIQEGSAL